jgi:hypothetical protein
MAHDSYPLRADREPSVLSYHVINIILFIRAKTSFAILLKSASTCLKEHLSFKSLGSGHCRGII